MKRQNRVLINGRVIDPLSGVDEIREIYIRDGRIAAGHSSGEEIIDLAGKWVVPGLIDMHVHLREPGEEYKETIASGCRAAAAGGFTAVACMPNTHPVNDNAITTRFIVSRAAGCAARVWPIGAISTGLAGEKLAEMGEMKREGAVAVSDDGRPVVNSQLMRRAMEYAASHTLPVISHSEDLALSRGGCMNEGALSTRMGLQGIPAAAEAVMVEREILLAELTGARVHIAHVSTCQSVALLRLAKEQGLAVTGESAPHYFTLTEDAVRGYNTNAKMSPPLRSEADREAIIAALADGVLDVIATDHAPHSILEKENEFASAANGITGLETSLPLTLRLVRSGALSVKRMVELMSCNPAQILGVPGGSLAVGEVADITVIDPDVRWTFRAAESFSKGKNSPFDGVEMEGRAVMTFLEGERVSSGDIE
ncbi:dihydroorotase [Desulforhopalus vacuolatus]|uniref:dihydroorotase n=1 Tax=Desulforhopalus vacuolatus TaxID=40414 RepID=UPI0019640577|nr:dihydroorotase [Desulforhopalus vacuolatus]MBM9519681.1 dihydroorotase [Desulforhopalus vacuolatus]